MSKLKFYRCQHCGNVVIKLVDSKVPVVCCGEPMQELGAGVVDAALEKHVPVVEMNGNECVVRIGEVEHPMIPEHFINFIVVETENSYYIKNLVPNEKPEATFIINDKVVAVYEYCNLHGLWKLELNK